MQGSLESGHPPNGGGTPGQFVFGDFELDRGARELRRRGERLALAATPFRLLVYLVEQRERAVSKEELLDVVWREVAVSEATLASTLNSVRQALGDDAATPRWIETRRGQGYRFVGNVEERRSGEVSQVRATRARLWRPALGAVLLLLAAALVWWRISTPTGSTQPIRSLAVLPLANLSGDPEQEYFADGITESLIVELGRMDSIRVISRTSVMQYKGSPKTIPVIGEELSVDAILEGTVTRDGDQVRVTAQLIDVRSDSHVWAESYNRDLREVLSLQSEMARAVAEQIRIELTPRTEQQLARRRPVDPEAVDALYKGMHNSRSGTRAGLERALQFFDEAIEADPDFAQAHLGQALVYFVRAGAPQLHLGMDPLDAMPRAKAGARKALELDDSFAQAHALLGSVHLLHDWNWELAEERLRRALELNPNNSMVLGGYARYLSTVGRHEEAISFAGRRRAVEPVSLGARASLVNHLVWARQFDRALEECLEIVETDPDWPYAYLHLAWVSAAVGRYEEAAAARVRFLRLHGTPSEEVESLERAFEASGWEGYQRAVLVQLHKESERQYVHSVGVAGIHAQLGELDAAFESLEQAYRERDSLLIYLKLDYVFDPLRADPRFDDLVRRVGIPAG